MSETIRFKVKVTDSGQRIDKLISSKCEELSRSRVQALIDEGLVTVNQKNVKANFSKLFTTQSSYA